MDRVHSLADTGISISNGALPDKSYIDIVNSFLYTSLAQKKCKYADSSNCLHHLLVYDQTLLLPLLRVVSNLPEIRGFFGMRCILHSIGAVVNGPSMSGYTHNWHTDSYEQSSNASMLNVLIPLTTFTRNNGCTKVYPRHADSPIDIELAVGDILMFDSSLTHCTGRNNTMSDRNCVTITLVKPYMKPQFDYLSLYSQTQLLELDTGTRQLLNYNNRMPVSLDEFYSRTVCIKDSEAVREAHNSTQKND